MNPIPLPKGLTGLESSPRSQELVRNMFMTSGDTPVLSIRPGVDQVTSGFGASRGAGLFANNETGDEELYMVSGTRLIRVTIINNRAEKILQPEDIQVDDLGEIPGNGRCILVGGFTSLCIMEVGGKGYVYNQVDGLEEITDPNYRPSVSVAYDNGRFVFVPEDGNPFFWSNLEDASAIDSEDFADAESYPDPNRCVFTVRRSIFVGGSRSFQRIDYDATRQTYVGRKGSESKVGYVCGLVKYAETFAFIGNDSDGDFGIYVMGEQPQLISNDAINELINKEYSFFDLRNIDANSVHWKNQRLTIFNLPRHTLVFYGAGWALWQSGVSGYLNKTWRISTIQTAYNYQWTGDEQSSAIGVLRDSGNEYGNVIEYAIKTFIRSTPESNFFVRRIAASVTAGRALGENIPQIMMAHSKDAKLPSQQRWRNLGRTGDYNNQVRWTGGISKAPESLTIWIIGYGNVPMNVDGLAFE